MVDTTLPLTEMIRWLQEGTMSSRELLDEHLTRVDQLDGDINAVVTRADDRARTEAQAVDDARANGVPVGPLAGVPITIKDALATEGIRSTGGAVELRDFVPDEDATVVATVREAGAIVFGKTNIPRWSGEYQSFNEVFGTTNNPWDLERTPGGSSGGPAAAVAMGFSAFEIGTDIGGSIRQPSSTCGIYGHKPSFGVIPTYGYLDNARFHRDIADVNVFGPMARSIDDLDLLFDLLAGPSPDDAPGWRLDLPPARAERLEDFRVVAWLDDPFCPVHPSVAAVLRSTVDALEDAGARIDHVRRPEVDPGRSYLENATLISAATDIEAVVAGGQPDMLSHGAWDVLHRTRNEIRQRWADFFADVDVLLCPVSPVPAFRHVRSLSGNNWADGVLTDFDDLPYRRMLRWNTLIGGAYLPVTTPPVGRTAPDLTSGASLPVGIQVVAPYLHDHTALAFARRITEVTGGYEPPPAAR
ncbi:MAG: amidase family protein [Actinomycetota bacterium]